MRLKIIRFTQVAKKKKTKEIYPEESHTQTR